MSLSGGDFWGECSGDCTATESNLASSTPSRLGGVPWRTKVMGRPAGIDSVLWYLNCWFEQKCSVHTNSTFFPLIVILLSLGTGSCVRFPSAKFCVLNYIMVRISSLDFPPGKLPKDLSLFSNQWIRTNTTIVLTKIGFVKKGMVWRTIWFC